MAEDVRPGRGLLSLTFGPERTDWNNT